MKDIDTSRYTITESGNVIRSVCRGGRMTALEEIKQKAEEWVNNEYDNSYYPDCNYSAKRDAEQAYIAGAEESEQLKQQIEKAKEIIKNLSDTLEVIDGEQIRELKVVKEAEQFLNRRRID